MVLPATVVSYKFKKKKKNFTLSIQKVDYLTWKHIRNYLCVYTYNHIKISIDSCCENSYVKWKGKRFVQEALVERSSVLSPGMGTLGKGNNLEVTRK